MAEQTVEIKDVMTAVSELRESYKADMKKYGEESAEHKEKGEKIEKFLDKFEDEKQAVLRENDQAKKSAGEMKERIEAMELELAKGGGSNDINYKEKEEYKALNHYAKFGDLHLNSEQKKLLMEQKTMRMDDNTTGGYLTSVEMDTSIIKKITEVSNVRSIARVRTINKKTLEIPSRTGIPTSAYEGEAEEGGESQAAYGSETLTAFRHTVTVPFTLDLLNDSNFDLETEINSDVAESFAQKEGNKFVLGTGVKQPEGFTINPAVVAGAFTSLDSSGALTAKDLTDLTGRLKIGYNPVYGFNRLSLSTFRSLEDGAGNPIWQAGLAAAVPNAINGENYVILQDMADIAANSLSVVYGDFTRGYLIIDRTGLSIIRDEVTSKKNAIVELTFHRWNTGKVILPEAIKLMKTKA